MMNQEHLTLQQVLELSRHTEHGLLLAISRNKLKPRKTPSFVVLVLVFRYLLRINKACNRA